MESERVFGPEQPDFPLDGRPQILSPHRIEKRKHFKIMFQFGMNPDGGGLPCRAVFAVQNVCPHANSACC